MPIKNRRPARFNNATVGHLLIGFVSRNLRPEFIADFVGEVFLFQVKVGAYEK